MRRQQLVHLFDDETVTTELARRVLEARSVLQPSIADWYRDQLARATSAKDQRALRCVLSMISSGGIPSMRQKGVIQNKSQAGQDECLSVILLFVVVVLFFYGAEGRSQSQIDFLILLACAPPARGEPRSAC